MSTLYDSRGRILAQPMNKKAAPPKLGEAFGDWAGRDQQIFQLPGGGIVQFDLSKLTLEDYRAMRDHYQVNASLAVLTFMQHQSDWRITCENKKIADFCEEQLAENWTFLNRAMGTANWAGHSPAVLQWENSGNKIILDKVKDLDPRDCSIVWKDVDAWAPPGSISRPKLKVYDGFRQLGMPYPVPVDNSFWYPLLMEHGDHSGRKLLRPAFTSWFFSLLVHLFANRYFERFGEPVPIGRAPFDEVIDVNGNQVRGNVYMLEMLQQLRNRSVVVLPNERTDTGNGRSDFDYDLEYLESQMRGADFERYLTRLDEEISIGLFTPILLLRTADVGSYNLGVGHMQVYLWMLNAMNADRKYFIDRYILSRMVDFNFGPNAPRAKITFRKLGNTDATMVKEILVALIQRGAVRPDVRELGEIAGMTLEEIEKTVESVPEEADPNADPAPDQGDPATGRTRVTLATGNGVPLTITEVVEEMTARIRGQVEQSYAAGVSPDNLTMGYKRKLERALSECSVSDARARTSATFAYMDVWLSEAASYWQEFGSADEFVARFVQALESRIYEAL